MKISVSKEDLSSGLQTVQNVVGARSTLPILSNVLLIAGDNKLELRATDLEVSIHAIVPESAGESWNPFSLLDLAVCLLSVQTREGHANLGAESDATARVAAMFYSFYNMRGAPRPAHPARR